MRSVACGFLCAAAIVTTVSAFSAAEPPGVGDFRSAEARGAKIRASLTEALVSRNAYERLIAIEQLTWARDPATPAQATMLAALAVDRTSLYSLECMRCKTEEPILSSACWGRYGHTDCHERREVGVYARAAIAQLKSEPAQAAAAKALWPIALRSDADAALVATLAPTLHHAFLATVRGALVTPQVATALRLLMSFPPGKCGGAQLLPMLEARMSAAESPPIRARAAAATLVCADADPAWQEPGTGATALLSAVLADPKSAILGELPAVAPIVRALAGPIGARMAHKEAADARNGTRLFAAFPAEARLALPGLQARLLVADEDETSQLLDIAKALGKSARQLKSAVLACARRHEYLTLSVVEAIAAMRLQLASNERAALKRAYRRWCRPDEDRSDFGCEPFDRALRR